MDISQSLTLVLDHLNIQMYCPLILVQCVLRRIHRSALPGSCVWRSWSSYCWLKATPVNLTTGETGPNTHSWFRLDPFSLRQVTQCFVAGRWLNHCITHFSFCCLAYFLLRCSRPRSRRSSSSRALKTSRQEKSHRMSSQDVFQMHFLRIRISQKLVINYQ